MKAPLYDQLIKYNKNMTSFHMPGHKFGKSLKLDTLSLLDLDVTEVEGLDNLYAPEGIILKAQEQMAKKYKSKETIFVTNGSTAGILASMMTVCMPGDSLMIARNSHNSVWNGLILGDINPIYINPSYEPSSHMLGGISTEELEKALIANPDAKGVLIVSPTYEGFVSDIEGIAKLVHQYKKILIVDEAHGAHFVWNNQFPKSAIEYGADIVIQSMHKTLPSLTQSALIHLGSDKINKKILLQQLQMIQTSSPSYAMMGLMDYIRAYMESQSELWPNYISRLSKTRAKLMKLENLQLLSKDMIGRAAILDLDSSKIVIHTINTNITGIKLGEILRNQYGIQVELESEEYIIAMSTIADTPDDLEKLCKALLEIDSMLKQSLSIKKHFNMIQSTNKGNILPRQVHFGRQEYISIDQAVERVSATNIMLYPPGIPLLCIGERFCKDRVHFIKNCKDRLQGLIKDNGCIQVLVLKELAYNDR